MYIIVSMDTERAASILALYELTGSVSETARQMGINKGTVSRALKRTGVPVPPPPDSLLNQKPREDWAAAWGAKERRGLEIVSERIENKETDTWDIMRWTGIASDKRYREEHPVAPPGNINVSVDQSQKVYIATNDALEALREARKQIDNPQIIEGS
mgnify:CR=1 FL=1